MNKPPPAQPSRSKTPVSPSSHYAHPGTRYHKRDDHQTRQMPVEAILITWQETTGTTPTADLIQETLAPYDLNTVLILLAQIAGMRKTWQNNPDNESDKELINELLPTHRQRITAFRTNKHVAFSRPGILAAAQHACTACKHRDQAPTPPTPQDIERILTCCIMAHDLLIKRQPTSNDTTVEKASTLLPLASYIPHNAFPSDLVRNLILLEDIAPTLQDRNDYIDLIQRFTSATGLPPRDLIALAYTASIQHLTTKRSTLRPFILTPNYLAHESIPPSHVTALLEHASITTQALSNESHAHPTTTPDFLSFQRHPLIEVQPGGYVTIDPGFLLDKAGRSLYWTLHDATPPADRHYLLTYWSMLIERYIHWLATTTYHGKGTLHLAPQFGNGDEASDLLITEGTSLIIMEVKASILTVAAKSGTRPELLQAELHRKAITGEDGERKGVAQLHHTLTRWLDGDDITGITRSTIRTIYPALVFLDHTFTRPYLHELYNEHFDRNRLCRTPKRTITPLMALTINDLENCLPYTHEYSLATMLDSYSQYNRGRAPEHRQFRIPILDEKQPGRDVMRERLNAFGQGVIDQRRDPVA